MLGSFSLASLPLASLSLDDAASAERDPDVTDRIVKGSTEVLGVYPSVLAQATGTPTVRIGTPAVSLPDSGQNVTVDTLSGSVDAALQGEESLTLVVARTIVANRLYLVMDSTTGQVIVVRATKGGSLTEVPIAEPLPMPIGAGSTFKGWRLSVTLTSQQTATHGRCVAEYTATLDGVEEKWAIAFRIVARSGVFQLTGDTLVSQSPYSRMRRPDDDDDYSRIITAAWLRLMEPALQAKGVTSERIVEWSLVNAAHIAAVELLLAKAYDKDQSIREEKKADFNESLNLALQSVDMWISPESEDLVVPDPDALPDYTITGIVR